MIFGLTKIQQQDKLQLELSKRYGKIPYYAWFPVRIDKDGRWVWLEAVLRENTRISKNGDWYIGSNHDIAYPRYMYHLAEKD